MADLKDLRIDLPVPKPGRRMGFSWGAPIFVVVSVAVLVLLFGNPFKGKSGDTGAMTNKTSSSLVSNSQLSDVETAAPGVANGGFTAGGYLEAIPPGPLVVSALIGGRVASIDVIPGQTVSANEQVATLDETQIF